jgi:hypothetical protein
LLDDSHNAGHGSDKDGDERQVEHRLPRSGLLIGLGYSIVLP